ncbi:MAG: flagellar hook-basal body complex protein FliE [Desulfobacteraceae bacterium]|nr:flagellar hook-basal body complex protein FliE [Desulfobacteraceae bacterium]
MTGIKGINPISLNTERLPSKINRRDSGFAKKIEQAVKDVNSKQNIADDAIEKVIKGELGIHEGMMMIGKAETSLKVLSQVRNKVMTAYNEVMRMQV